MHGGDNTVGDWPLVELAERQEGLLRHGQLNDLGLSDDAIFARLSSGRLHRKRRGVYALGHRLQRSRGEWIAAVWAVPGSVLSHQSAAAFHGWTDSPAHVQHVTTIRHATSREGLCVHRVNALFSADIEHHGLLAVTTPARTLIDLAEVLPWGQLRAITDRIRHLDVSAVRAARRLPLRPSARDRGARRSQTSSIC